MKIVSTNLASRLLLGLTLSLPGVASAVTSFVEDFGSDAANWRDSSGLNALPWVATGGVGGPMDGYVTTTANFMAAADGDSAVLFRGHDAYNSSADAFVGNWVADSVQTFAFWVRHNAPEPLVYFTRFATSGNFPASNAIQPIAVAPDTWTLLSVAIDPGNAQLQSEGPFPFNSIFGALGNLQLAVNVPAGLAGMDATYTFELDRPGVTVVPEPGSVAIALLGSATLFIRRRR